MIMSSVMAPPASNTLVTAAQLNCLILLRSNVHSIMPALGTMYDMHTRDVAAYTCHS